MPVVERDAVMAAIKAIRERHTPPNSATGSIYSEALQVCSEIGNAVLALPEVTKTEEEKT